MSMTNTGDIIPLKSIADLNSLSATVALTVDGTINGERTKGNLNGLLTMNGRNSKVSVSGSLLGEIAAQVGGSIVGLFTPSAVDLYKVPQGAYIVINGIFPMCVKPKAPKALSLLDEISPQSLLTMLTSSDVARGTLVAEGTLNGRPVQQYVIDGETFLAAAQQSSDPQLRAFAAGLWSAEDADLFVDAEGGYPVAFQGSYTGAYEPLKFQGKFDVQIALTSVNTGTPVVLPAMCSDPISM